MTFYSVNEILGSQIEGMLGESTAETIEGTSKDRILTDYSEGTIESIRSNIAALHTQG